MTLPYFTGKVKKNKEIKMIKDIILEKISCLNPTDKGDYATLNCPACNTHDAYIYYKAGRFAHIHCNHINKCGRKTPIAEYWGNDWSPNGHAPELAKYAENHGINLKGLEELGLVDEQGNIICVAPGVKKVFEYKAKDDKFGWLSKGVKKNEIGRSFYRPFIGNPEDESLYIFEGDANFLKACQDSINCSSTLFGASSNPTEENISEWQPFKTILICFDSDSAGIAGAGKLAKALNKALKNRVGIITLPLQPSQGKDYCDYRRLFDINKFSQIEPTWCSLSKSEKKFAEALKSATIPQETIIKQIPQEAGIGYVVTKNAVYVEKCVENDITKETHNVYEKVIDQAIWVDGIIRDIWSGEESVSLSWGNNQKGIFPVETISFAKHIDMLASKGIRLNSLNTKDAIAYFSAALGRGELETSFSSFKNGWVDDERFIYGNEIIEKDKSSKIDFQGNTYVPERLGNKEKWFCIMEMFKNDVGISFRLGSAAISPALKILGCTSFINHYWGSSTSGKSLSSFLAASMFGNPYKIVENWNQSRSGKETYFEEAGGLPSFLDEAHQAKPEDLELTCYDFANEKGKGRATITTGGEIRKAKAKTWFGALLSTGECQIKEHSKKAGTEARNIELQRIIEISKEEGVKASKAKTLLLTNFGHIGKEIIQAILNNKESILEAHLQFVERLAEYSSNNLQSRQVQYLAASLTGCQILASLGLSLAPIESIFDYVVNYMQSEIPQPTWQKALDYIHDCVTIHQDKFEQVETNALGSETTLTPDKECWGKISNAGIDFIPEALRKILIEGEFDYSVLKILSTEGKIAKDNSGKNSVFSRIRGNVKRVIRIL